MSSLVKNCKWLDFGNGAEIASEMQSRTGLSPRALAKTSRKNSSYFRCQAKTKKKASPKKEKDTHENIFFKLSRNKCLFLKWSIRVIVFLCCQRHRVLRPWHNFDDCFASQRRRCWKIRNCSGNLFSFFLLPAILSLGKKSIEAYLWSCLRVLLSAHYFYRRLIFSPPRLLNSRTEKTVSLLSRPIETA